MKGRIPEELVDEIIQHNDIVDVINEYLPLKSAGSNYRALCPFHNEKTPSFMVSREKQLYKCFGCGQGGGVVQFIMEKENLDFVDAIHYLARRAGIQIPETNITSEEKLRMETNRKLAEMHREAATFFYHQLTSQTNPGFIYLKNRSWKKQTIKQFGLGYAPDQWDSLLKYLLDRGYSRNMIKQGGLATTNKKGTDLYDRFRKRLMFPIFNVRGDIVGFGGRVVDPEDKPKYLNSPETAIFNKRKLMYGLNIARTYSRKMGSILVVEGYTDVISLHENGFKNTVATLGTSLTMDHIKLLSRYTNAAVLCFDADSAGSNAVLRSIDLFAQADLAVRILTLPEGMDPDQYIKDYGSDSFEKLISQSPTSIDYQVALVRKKHSLATVEGKIHFAREVANILKKLKSAVEKEAYAARLAEEMGISKSALLSEIQSSDRKSGKKYRHDSRNKKQKGVMNINPMQPMKEDQSYLLAEKQLLKWMLENLDELDTIKEFIDPKSFFYSPHSIIFETIFEHRQQLKKNPHDFDLFEGFKEDFQKVIQVEIGHLSKERVIDRYRLNYKRKKLKEELDYWMDRQSQICAQEGLGKDEKEDEMLKIGVEVRRINIELQKISLQKGGGENGKQ
ncbi:MAG: DNA primase [Tindallia sp. MSAO_Bac2]|nr:MAG: DNA primase [Tindallia sp. MSAO_Bac2]